MYATGWIFLGWAAGWEGMTVGQLRQGQPLGLPLHIGGFAGDWGVGDGASRFLGCARNDIGEGGLTLSLGPVYLFRGDRAIMRGESGQPR